MAAVTKRKTKLHTNLAQLLFTLTSGGASLADAERLAQDRVLMQLLGLDKGADQTTLGEWLRGQTKESVLALHRINADWVDWASQQAKPGRWQHGGEVELFFDDTQIEVEGHKFEGARINYEGNRALGWQTLWYGPWLLDGILDGAGDVSEHLPVLLAEHQPRWQGRASYLYADSGSSAGKYLNRIEQAGFTRWSISYNKWTDTLDRLGHNPGGLRARRRTPQSGPRTARQTLLPVTEPKNPALPGLARIRPSRQPLNLGIIGGVLRKRAGIPPSGQ